MIIKKIAAIDKLVEMAFAKETFVHLFISPYRTQYLFS